MNDDPMSLLLALMIFIRSNEESATKSRRLKASWTNKRMNAGETKLSARCPAWLRLEGNQFVLIDDRAAVVRRIFEMAKDGCGLHKIAEVLNRDCVPCFGSAKHWHKSYISKIIDSTAPSGVFVPHEIVHTEVGKRERKPLTSVENYFPSVVDAETYRSVRLMRSDVRTPPVRSGVAVSNVLAGLAKCPICNGTMTRVSKGSKRGGHPYLVCQKAKVGAGCSYRAVKYLPVEEALVTYREYILADAPSGNLGLNELIDEVRLNISTCDDEIDNLLDDISRQPSLAVSNRLREVEDEKDRQQLKLKALQEQFAAESVGLVGRTKHALELALSAPELDRGEVNRYLRTLLLGVVVDYRIGRLTLMWKQGDETRFIFDSQSFWSDAELNDD